MIRAACGADLPRILEIYAAARRYMRENGNPTQWGDNRPEPDTVEGDIRKNQLYVLEDEKGLYGVFAFILGEDPTYGYIEDGAWLNDGPYGTIHRIASDGVRQGVLGECLNWCKVVIGNLRVDTHENNHTMQHLLKKHGFVHCGTIYVEDGTPRMAYQYTQRAETGE